MGAENTPRVSLTLRQGASSQSFSIERGATLVSVATDHETELTFVCCRAACGECLVRVSEHPENLSECGPEERKLLAALDAGPDARLACQCRVLGDVELEV